ncbi:MAG TPA: P1 family peptidase [Polyangia bacterium]|nr:P1 family peptidase [Polyangia bacterium]
MRRRLRDLGFSVGRFPVGPHNAITDVGGVRVGHTTLIAGDGPLEVGEGPVRTGVTAIVPTEAVIDNRVLAGSFVLNGAGEVSGLTQVAEWGFLETPILLTNTLAVGKVSDAAVKWMTRQSPGIGVDQDVIIPIVGECDDSWLNDAVGRHVRSEHVYRAIEQAAGGPVGEGSVGAGTGLITCDFKAGIGTSSRRVETQAASAPAALPGESYTLGILVQSNFGIMRSLRVNGAPVGEVLERAFTEPRRERNAGSIITIIATDAPLLSSQLVRLCKRAALGIGRIGSFAAHGSGEIIVAFSTANKVPRQTSRMTARLDVLLDEACDPLYEAVVEGTEEAILNALCMADEMRGQSGHLAPALPLDRLAQILRAHEAAFASQSSAPTEPGGAGGSSPPAS